MSWLAFIPVVAGYLASMWIIVQSIAKRIDSLETRVAGAEPGMQRIEHSLGVLEERTGRIVSQLDQHDARMRSGGV